MYHVSAQGVDERMINVHYYYYYNARFCMFEDNSEEWRSWMSQSHIERTEDIISHF